MSMTKTAAQRIVMALTLPGPLAASPGVVSALVKVCKQETLAYRIEGYAVTIYSQGEMVRAIVINNRVHARPRLRLGDITPALLGDMYEAGE